MSLNSVLDTLDNGPTREGDPALVALLQSLVERAKRGEIVGVTASLLGPQEDVWVAYYFPTEEAAAKMQTMMAAKAAHALSSAICMGCGEVYSGLICPTCSGWSG